MKNYKQPGCILDIPAPAGGAVSGVPFLAGVVLCVPQKTEAATVLVACCVHGVFELPKATGFASTIGGNAYWDDTAKKITATSSGNTLVGYFTEVAASGDTLVDVKLDR